MKWEDRDGFLAILQNKKKFGIFLDMGVGKTSLNLALADIKFFEDVKKILIITPKIVSLSTWQDEIDKWDEFNYMSSVLELVEGTEKKRLEILKNTGEFCIHIISSGITEWMTGKYIRKVNKKTGKKYKVFVENKITPKYDMIIVDECSQFKDTSSHRFRALKKLVNEHLYLLSGTPFSNIEKVVETNKKTQITITYYTKADELYYIFYLLDLFKGSRTQFQNDFCYTVRWDLFNYRMTVEIYDMLIDVLNHHSISKKLEMKVAKNEIKVYCKTDKKRMNELIEDFYIETDQLEEITIANKAIMINKALQLSNGFVYDNTREAIKFNDYKFQRLLEILSIRRKDNIIIFYNFIEDKELLLKELKGSRLLSSKKDIDDWNLGIIPILIISPFSAKYGLNLQDGGHVIIWFGLIWSAESYTQANARLYRPGQLNDVDIYYLLGEETYDDYVFNKLVAKNLVLDNFIDYTETHRNVK